MEICPISGLPCPHKKVIHITDVENYKAVTTSHLCVFCNATENTQVQQQQMIGEIAAAVLNTISSLINQQPIPQQQIIPQPIPQPQIPTCSKCGYTIFDIVHNKKLGCDNCYEAFKKELLPLLKEIHNSTQHVGKKPKNIINMSHKALQEKLKEAIEKEDYEQAAIIKSQIDKLK